MDVPKVVDRARTLFAPMEAEPMMGALPDEDARTLWVDKVQGLRHKDFKQAVDESYQEQFPGNKLSDRRDALFVCRAIQQQSRKPSLWLQDFSRR